MLGFECQEVRDGERLAFGDLQLECLHTPGHTPEHISVVARQRGEPARVFTGDTLFVGAAGRPDLLGEAQTRQLAGELYDSLFRKLLTLDDTVEVHPGHGAGSLCGTAIGAEPHSTIGQERRFNPTLQHRSREAFVAAVLADLPDTPRLQGDEADQPGGTGRARPRGRLLRRDRSRSRTGGGRDTTGRLPDRPARRRRLLPRHPAGALNIAFGPRVGYWAGWVVPAGTRVVLLARNAGEASEAGRQLLRVGLDAVEGYIEGGLEAWRLAGLPTSSIEQLRAA